MNELKAMVAAQIIAAQIRGGAKHPSPVLLAEAVDTAEALLAELEVRAAAKRAAEAPPAPPAPPPAGAPPAGAAKP